ncbi:rCG27047 [Rattus norvegicus]|uniref:RCG27047 n=1 Tax=Rattus norvegicus TaxID=10116 RepID=A6HNF7_RAT|nr:rCG27047 [Rattus norvegicus]
MQQFATRFWEWRPAVRHPGQADAHALAVPCPSRGGTLFTRCAGRRWRRSQRREDLLADRACDLS